MSLLTSVSAFPRPLGGYPCQCGLSKLISTGRRAEIVGKSLKIITRLCFLLVNVHTTIKIFYHSARLPWIKLSLLIQTINIHDIRQLTAAMMMERVRMSQIKIARFEINKCLRAARHLAYCL